MEHTEPQTGVANETGWNALTAVLLGSLLLTAGWLDLRTYLAHAKQGWPDFAFVAPTGGTRSGEVEAYQGASTYVLLEHLGAVEVDQKNRLRHGFGPRSFIRIWSQAPHAVLDMQYYNDVADQEMTVSYGEQTLEQFTRLPVGMIARSYPLKLQPGMNEFVISVARYCGHGVEAASNDDRPMAGVFKKLDLSLH